MVRLAVFHPTLFVALIEALFGEPIGKRAEYHHPLSGEARPDFVDAGLEGIFGFNERKMCIRDRKSPCLRSSLLRGGN